VVGEALNVEPVAIEVELPCTNQLTVPEQPLAVSKVAVPEQITSAVGVIAGALGFGLTVTTTLATGLLQIPVSQTAK
jgi:hypothetical protein